MRTFLFNQKLANAGQDFNFVGYMYWGKSGGGSGGSVEPPILNVETYSKRMVKKKVNQLN